MRYLIIISFLFSFSNADELNNIYSSIEKEEQLKKEKLTSDFDEKRIYMTTKLISVLKIKSIVNQNQINCIKKIKRTTEQEFKNELISCKEKSRIELNDYYLKLRN